MPSSKAVVKTLLNFSDLWCILLEPYFYRTCRKSWNEGDSSITVNLTLQWNKRASRFLLIEIPNPCTWKEYWCSQAIQCVGEGAPASQVCPSCPCSSRNHLSPSTDFSYYKNESSPLQHNPLSQCTLLLKGGRNWPQIPYLKCCQFFNILRESSLFLSEPNNILQWLG